jgi:serpin B
MFLSGKMQKISFYTLIMLCVLSSGNNFAANIQNSNFDKIVSGNNEFALNLYSKMKELPQIKADECNLFISPYSISTAFAMVYSGARGNTAKEIADILCFPQVGFEQVASDFNVLQKHLQANQEAAGFQLNLANSLWLQKGYDFVPEFLELNKKYFDAGLSELDFTQSEDARKTINDWVEKQTKEKITDLIPAGMIDGLTRLILTNAIYFKGNWVIPFKEENTKPADFNVTKDKKVQVQMMYQKERYKYAKTDDMELLQIPYGLDEVSMIIMEISRDNNRIISGDLGYNDAGKLTREQLKELPNLSMLILLPKSIGDLDINLKTLESYIQKMKEQEVEVYLPKFKFSCDTIELKDILIEMGLKDAFTGRADFSGINPQKELFISNVLHKTFVEVNEKGTEAAAASSLRMMMDIPPAPPPIFRADRPFIFIIRDNKTESILFMGRVVNPSRKE